MYDHHATDDVSVIVTNINELKLKKNQRQALKGNKRSHPIATIAGRAFTSYARSKAAAQDGDLYAEYVAPALKTSMFVETWRRGAGGPLESSCKANYKVYNINIMKLNFDKKSKFPDSGEWSYISDHSKWGMSDNSLTPVVCIGDVNRMESQNKRGGGTVCIKDQDIWNVWRNSIHELESCSKKG